MSDLSNTSRLPDPTPFAVQAGDVTLRGERSGAGPPIVLLHGLTATRRYVVMGSRLLERRGYELISYDARAHGESGSPRDSAAFDYADLLSDLEAVLDSLELERVVLAGSSMGAATAIVFALARPERVAALVQATPAYTGSAYTDPEGLASWDRLADGLARDGIEGFMDAYAVHLRGRFAESIERLTRQRLSLHDDVRALAPALRVVPRSAAFNGIQRLSELAAPTLIVASRDEGDPTHPLAVAEDYARRIPVAELVVEEPGKPPLAWRGAHVSRAIAAFLADHDVHS